MKVRAAVLSAVDAPLEIADLDLDPPRAGEVLVRIAASGVCHSDVSTANGTIGTRLPAVLGHEGAGVVEAVGPAVASIAVGDHVVLSWNPSCGACEECLRGLPHLCTAAWDAMFAGGLMDGTPRLHRDGREIYHYSFISSFAERAVVPARSCVRIDPAIPLDIAALVGCAVTTGIGTVWNTAGVRPGERVAVYGCGGVGLSAVLGASAVGAAPIIAVDRRSDKLAVAVSLGATGAVLWDADAQTTAEAVARAAGGGVDYAIDAVGRPEVLQAAFLSTRRRGAAVAVGIPRQNDVVTLPALTLPRMERRLLGSIYGSARPERDFPLILHLFMRGRLPLDRLISHRLPLDGIGEAFDLVSTGAAVRAVIELDSSGRGGP
jgi:S-(hydroxymethyl)glutathione dehydrogenase / alcohol dehydrogenase